MRTATWTAVGGAALAAAVQARRRGLTYGATAAEASRELPGDELLPHAALITTRAVTITAAPSSVWPWLVQMGGGRGGSYSYDWIVGTRSADAILPEFQQLAVGDVLPVGQAVAGMRVERCEAEQTLVLRSVAGDWVWSLHLSSLWLGTRLISRNRVAAPPGGWLWRTANRAVLEPGSLVMERRMLLGVKERAEWNAPRMTM
ncbi:hypothetical protein BJ973_002886 [Actinoplanes tereljensis]|uniref:Uncharacterized protein n=1 Tax=Paractinoplanes tereljensis TaxID=571912 RepID=A0A919TTI2_9ACTN|nr:SRPBCC family protein [Actinoplanes tereljensis]GIF22563.1 hypothetical protein Ate02nite_52930 [Actinoplanes tereljensis]